MIFPCTSFAERKPYQFISTTVSGKRYHEFWNHWSKFHSITSKRTIEVWQ